MEERVLTKSRYDIMLPGLTEDIQDGEAYPDTLSVNFSNFTYTEPPFILTPDTKLQEKAYLYSASYYNEPYYDDVVMNINGIFHTSDIFNAEEIKFPTKTDLVKLLNP